MAVLRAVYGLPIPNKLKRSRRVLKQCTGRDVSQLPEDGFDTALFLTGRRSGKSRIAAVMGAYEAALAGHEQKLAKGELGIVPIISPTKRQSRIVKDYLRAIFNATPILQAEVAEETREGFDLRSGVKIEILAGDWRTIRGYTLLAAIIDEAAFFGLDEESKVKSDTELIRALKPALKVGCKLIGITTPYARKGWTWQTYQRHFGKNDAKTLVVNCPSRTLNSTLSQSDVDEALAEDFAAAKSEYLGEFRDDVGQFIPRQVIEDLVVTGRTELQPQPYQKYFAFVDVSGGRGDAAALAIAHKKDRTVVLDFIKLWKPPFDPHDICKQMAQHIRKYGVTRLTGDNYAAEFVAQAFTKCGLRYFKAEKPKSQLYVELLPRLCSREIELLDSDLLVNQLAGLERRTRSGGRDIIDHPPGGHDDLTGRRGIGGEARPTEAGQAQRAAPTNRNVLG